MKLRLLIALVVLAESAAAQLPPGDGPNQVATTALESSPIKFSDALLSQLRVPAGFKINVFAKDMQHVRWMQVAPNGDIYVSRPKQGDVLLLRDADRNGVMDFHKIVVPIGCGWPAVPTAPSRSSTFGRPRPPPS